MTGFKNVLEGILNFFKKLLDNEVIQDALEDAAKEAAKQVAVKLVEEAAKTSTRVDDFAAVVVSTALKMEPVDPEKLND